MPSPVSASTYPAASPTSSTRPRVRAVERWRRGPAPRGPGERSAAEPLLEQRVLGQQLVERHLPLGQHRDPDQFVGDWGHVGLRPRGPVHLDERRPRRHLHVHPEPEPAAALGRPVEAEHPAHRGVQPVRGNEVAGGLVVDEHVAATVLDLPDRALHDLDARVGHRVGERPVQRGAADPAPVAVAERRVRGAAAAEVADPGQPVAGRVYAEGGEVGDGAGHESLAAGLVDRAGARLADLDVEARARRRTARWRARPARRRR